MFDLAVKAFSFDGIDGSIEIYIEEVFGYPDETSIDGGYDLRGFINLRANCYSVTNGELWLSSGGLYRFKNQLEPCYKSLQGNAQLRTFKHEFSLEAEFRKNGHFSADVIRNFLANKDSSELIHQLSGRIDFMEALDIDDQLIRECYLSIYHMDEPYCSVFDQEMQYYVDCFEGRIMFSKEQRDNILASKHN